MGDRTSRRKFVGTVAATPLAVAGTRLAARDADEKRGSRAASSTPDITPWIATCIQTAQVNLSGVTTREDARAILNRRISEYEQLVSNAAERRTDLALFPEYMMGGSGNDLVGVLDFPGPEIERIQTLAQKYRMYIGGHAYARDPDFPGRYFNTSFLLDRAGDVALKYYRIHTYHSNSPHDFWQRFLDKVGLEGAFPVARTELGNLSILPSMEFMYPEITRMFVLRGAEVVLHDTAEQIVDESVKRARAAENMIFVMSTNTSNAVGRQSMRVGSRIVNWEGEVMASVDDGLEAQCTSIIDVEGLRKRRSSLDIDPPAPRGLLNVNYLSRFRVEVCREVFNTMTLYPPDTYEEGTVVKTSINPQRNSTGLGASLQNMIKSGLISTKYVET